MGLHALVNVELNESSTFTKSLINHLVDRGIQKLWFKRLEKYGLYMRNYQEFSHGIYHLECVLYLIYVYVICLKTVSTSRTESI